MEWYIFALLAPGFWAINSVFIKFLITNKFRSYYPTIATISSMDAVFALFLAAMVQIEVNIPYSILAFLAGLLPLTAFWFYSKAILIEEVSRIATLFQLIPLFVIFLSVTFFSEILGPQRYLGIGLIIFAATLISYKKSLKKTFSGAMKFMVPFALIIAVYTIVDKQLLEYLSFSSVFFWNIIGVFCGAMFLLVFPKFRKEYVTTIRSVGKKTLLSAFVGEGMYVTGTICSLVALSMVGASLATTFFALQPFYVFFYILLLNLFFPKILKEEITRKTLSLKIFSIVLMFVGTWLIL